MKFEWQTAELASFLSLHQCHHVLRIPISRRGRRREHFINPPQIFFAQLYLKRAYVLLQIFPPLRSRDRHNVIPLRQHPRQRQLRRLASLLFRNLLHPPHQIQILLEIFSLKARAVAPIIIRRQIFEAPKLPGQKAASQRTVSHEANPQFATCRPESPAPDRASTKNIQSAALR